MRALAVGKGDYKKYKKLLQEKFILLNVYCRSVKEEHDPRGPEGPYQFTDRSVPVLLFKRWNGETLVQQLGFASSIDRATPALARFVDKALKKNGPVAPPKALRPLLKSMKKAEASLEKQRIGAAVRELQEIVKAAANKKKFSEQPVVAAKAQEHLDALLKDARKKLEEADRLEGIVKKKEFNRIAREYGALGDIKKRAKAALKAMNE